MAARRDALKFVRLLAKHLQTNDADFSPGELEQHFRGAVDSLPETELKRTLEQSFSYFKKQLFSALKPSGNSGKDDKTKPSLEYNLFVRGELDNVITSATSLPMEQRLELYQKLWQCYPTVLGTDKLHSIFPDVLREKYRGGSNSNRLEKSLEMVNKYQKMTFGCYDRESVINNMELILEEISPICEECGKLPHAQERQQRAVLLQNVIRNLVVSIHTRFQEHKRQEAVSSCEDLYNDLMAALLSLHLDVNLFSERTDLLRDAGNSVLLILGHSPSHLMDVLLQLTALAKDNVPHILPLIRLVLNRNSGMLKHSAYIKFVCLARLACRLGTNSPEDITHIRQVAELQSAPVGFFSWLARRDQRISRNLALSGKMSGVQVTKKLLDTEKDEDMESLLDVACDAAGTADGTSRDREEAPRTEEPGTAPAGEELLFFVDSTGDAAADASQEVEYDSNRAEEALLHKQLSSLIDRLDNESESEGEDLFDEILHSDQPADGMNANTFERTAHEAVAATASPAGRAGESQSLPYPAAGPDKTGDVETTEGNTESSDEEQTLKLRSTGRRSKRPRATPRKGPSDEENDPTQPAVKKQPKRSLRPAVITRGRSARERK